MIKNKFIFYLLSWTWGLLMNLIGAIAALFLIVTGHKPYKFGYCYCFEVGKGWGGCSLGMFVIYSKASPLSTKCHEHGHSIQNCSFGPLMPFVVCIPSAIRYWYREYLHRVRHVQYRDMPSYDSIWFEGSATKIGTNFYNWFETTQLND